MEFMTEMYDDDWSGDTEMINIRGSGRVAGSSGRVFELPATLVTRLMSRRRQRLGNGEVWRERQAGSQQIAFVNAPTNPMGSAVRSYSAHRAWQADMARTF